MSVLKSRGGDKYSQPLTILDCLSPQSHKGLALYIGKPPPKLAKILRFYIYFEHNQLE